MKAPRGAESSTTSSLRRMQPDSRSGQPVVLVADALATNPDGLIPLVRNVGNWWLPGGRVEAGESFVAAAIREMAEETKLVLEPEGLVRLSQQTHGHRRVVFVTVRGSVTGDLARDPTDMKISDVRWVAPDDLDRYVPEHAHHWRGLLTAPTIGEAME